ncbi:Helix-turn-helix [Maribacter orientalis]|uniref:Helix-turn-helix n=1 Tax=Maribacter orientalis TaxID=228957 RepID=A0A1H7T913_9FLAO|nr:helix-turn-helix domain-containing protein [Maribacter orientalis]SEL80317.1 Helix-turn-helix [Maribacter orientalis]
MSILLELRDKLNLTQEELAEKANISVRTIQRIESGTKPKGFTLEALSNALGVSKDVLLKDEIEPIKSNKNLIKYINLSSIPLLIIPLGSIILPLIIMYWKKQINTITKQIISIQILWTLASILLVIASSFLKNWFSLSNQVTTFTILTLLVVNLYIILRNTMEIEKRDRLHIKLNFSFL